MQEKNPKELLRRVMEGTATEQERAMLESWYFSWRKDEPAGLTEQDHVAAKAAIYSRLPQPEAKQHKLVPWQRPATTWLKGVAVAAAVFLIVFGAWLYFAPRQPEGSEATWGLYATDIAPGKQGATLTLANGKVILLSDAKSGVVVGNDLKYSDGTSVVGSLSSRAKAKDLDSSKLGMTKELGMTKVMQMTAATAKGQTYQFTLSDGTKVWLNADSKLEFPSNFRNAKQRIVQLAGEGYFEIAKDKAHPFIVESGGQKVEVLGTHFNINSYKDEVGLRTTLLEGSIRLTAGNRERVLRPGQQAAVNGGSIQVKEINTEEAVAWQKGYFRFYDEPIESIMRKVSRWYNVEVVYNGSVPSEGFNARITRYSTIKEVLEILESTKAVHFKVEGRRVIVSKE